MMQPLGHKIPHVRWGPHPCASRADLSDHGGGRNISPAGLPAALDGTFWGVYQNIAKTPLTSTRYFVALAVP
jgi:hypothetical protein